MFHEKYKFQKIYLVVSGKVYFRPGQRLNLFRWCGSRQIEGQKPSPRAGVKKSEQLSEVKSRRAQGCVDRIAFHSLVGGAVHAVVGFHMADDRFDGRSPPEPFSQAPAQFFLAGPTKCPGVFLDAMAGIPMSRKAALGVQPVNFRTCSSAPSRVVTIVGIAMGPGPRSSCPRRC